ncbi:membrane protein [Bacillus sp. SA1-12]|uniref:DUF456 domain-containing protein n=1 Tax=Bacillus sp. SA1-12 TaxID=1455638 RepID=UPI000626F5D8|nr:DUF456 domain-containing protein [Bacillus sp. SA1-12]KKI88600.1 membrane protein [Bacillus sp. SA1-12]
MEYVYWSLIVLMFIIAFVGLVYPIIPSVVFIVAGFILYGFLFGFSKLSIVFWIIEGLFVAILFAADYLTNLVGVKKFGGSKAAIWGSTIGLIVGPFVIPFLGIILGPFIGAVIAELIVHKKDFSSSIKSGVGSLIGFISGVVAKGVLQLIMIGYFFVVIL